MTATAQLVCLLFVIGTTAATTKWSTIANDATQEMDDEFDRLSTKITTLGRQLRQQQFFNEERVRSEGNSGIKHTRIRNTGSMNYHADGHSGGSVSEIHDHQNNIRTVGMGEVIAVLNGVEFRTRHNDYRLNQPHSTSAEYHATEEIEFPDVPPAVTEKATIDEQVEEMRQWFKAFSEQNTTERDYRAYFPAALCYLEGAWTLDDESLDEPYYSDRHSIEADTWHELEEKIRFTSSSGGKDKDENLAFLPTTVVEMDNSSEPVLAQWNYRIMCHKLSRDLPLNRLRMVEDLANRMAHGRTVYEHLHSRAARFEVNTKDQDTFEDGIHNYGLLDELMEEIPGFDNYQGNLDGVAVDGKAFMNMDGTTSKDTSRYHRWYKINFKDAVGQQQVRRSFADDNMFAAMTTQEKVMPVSADVCSTTRSCSHTTYRWSYAVPLEIIYLTPLSKWNPHNLAYKGDASGATSVNDNGRNGKCTDASTAFDGTNSKNYYITPTEFYSGSEASSSSADTGAGEVCVLDPNGVSHKVRGTGTRIFLPSIDGVGILRQRYPIVPVHGEGSSVWKELNALRAYVMQPSMYSKYAWDSVTTTSENREFRTSDSSLAGVTLHHHTVTLTSAEYAELLNGAVLTKDSDQVLGHTHEFSFKYVKAKDAVLYQACDGASELCWDRHAKLMTLVTTDDEAATD